MRRYTLPKPSRAHGLHFTPCGGQLLACVGADSSWVTGAILLDLTTGEERARIEQQGTCYAVPPDVSRFVLGGANHWVNEFAGVVWADLPDLASWKRQTWQKRSLPPSYVGVHGLAFDPTGARLAVAHSRASIGRGNRHSSGPYLTITEPNTGEAEFNLPATGASGLAFSADGARLAATGGAPDVTVFDLATRAPLVAYRPPRAPTRALRFLPDGRLAVANGNTAFVLRSEGGQQFALTGHTSSVNALAVTPDGKRLLSASDDGTVRAWDLSTGATVAEFDWKIGPVTALACAPDGLTCAAAGTGGQVVLWDADG